MKRSETKSPHPCLPFAIAVVFTISTAVAALVGIGYGIAHLI